MGTCCSWCRRRGGLIAFATLLLGVPVRGSWLLLAFVSLVGALAFSGLGLLTAARPRTIEGVSGIMNLALGGGITFVLALKLCRWQ